ncbi:MULTISPECIES: RSP_2648 family PIN domain-containing protein [Roseinatronobacter]|uniref:PIN domain-containing protein n=1 Tax=Roseinatronobacter domitianus TaxID=2940293 RepID=A0ABT0LY96_9RHOB|nr:MULTISPECIES: PIN domain-containing protein [Roseibaca]MCL1627323.1 PIN domain-containing protein [Roseibaca domitiana]
MRLVLDACVLYPTILREILIGVAEQGGFVPLWSARILGEWQHAAARLGPEGAQVASGEIAILRARWPKAEIPADPVLEARLSLPDPADCHVLAAAILGRADAVVTLNLRDFPTRQMEGMRATSPDDLLMDLWLADSAMVEQAVTQVRDRAQAISGQPRPLRAMLKRAKLPRLGKALDG